MEQKPLGPFCSATDWEMLSSKRIHMVPHRKIPRPGVTTGGAGDTVQTFLFPLRSCPTCLGLHGRTQRPIVVEPLCSDKCNPLPTVLRSSADCTLCLCLQFGRGRGKEGKLSCQSSACQVGGRWNQSSQISSLEEPSVRGKLSNNLHLSDAVTRSWFSFCWQSFSYGQRPDHRKDLV